MLLHTMAEVGKSTDYMVGAQLEGFDRMLDIQPGNEFSVIEGDEYLSSPSTEDLNSYTTSLISQF